MKPTHEADAETHSTPTRRQLRDAERARTATPVEPEGSARRHEVPRRVSRPALAAKPIPAPRVRSTRTSPLRVLIAAAIVPGLFATAALPAYASSFAGPDAVASSKSAVQSLTVAASAADEAITRDEVTATSDAEMAARVSDPERALRVTQYDDSGALALGDDYPWPYEAADVEGGGLSPLSYYYRECVDFVAWRLNRDAGVTQAPWKYNWFTLTPNGGDASQWASNWRSHDWPTGSDPVAGSVAWFNGNHVAYVKSVLDDGNIVIEEYNHGSTHKYGVRTIAASDVALFLYAPPR
jgi:hypothetical protein